MDDTANVFAFHSYSDLSLPQQVSMAPLPRRYDANCFMKHAKEVFLLNYSKGYIFALPTDWQNRVVLKHLDSDCKRHHERMVCYPALGQMILVCTYPTDLKVNSQHKVLGKENYKCSTDKSIEMTLYTDFYCVKSRSFLKY